MNRVVLIKNDVIIDEFMNVENKTIQELQNLYVDIRVVEVPTNTIINIGETVNYFHKNWIRKTDKELLDENIITLENDEIIDSDNLKRKLTLEERVERNMVERKRGYKAVQNQWLPLSMKEKLEYNEITINEYIEYREHQKRLERNSMLNRTDSYMIEDYPIHEDLKKLYMGYRQYLRDFTKQDNFYDLNIKTFDEWKENH